MGEEEPQVLERKVGRNFDSSFNSTDKSSTDSSNDEKDDLEEGNLILSSYDLAVVKQLIANLVQGSREDSAPLQEEGGGRGNIRSPLHFRGVLSDQGRRENHGIGSEIYDYGMEASSFYGSYKVQFFHHSLLVMVIRCSPAVHLGLGLNPVSINMFSG